ncbi:hypothetical protein K440DRAFT_642448 [Wilcoxina mikolae CBS 423.85]|nr:hypothetical protein K440DRAFT_642448 [Wilcoxina mikolae CBS 423.85]
MLRLQDLTFGLELELICTRQIPSDVEPEYDYDDADEDPGRPIRDALISKLRSIGVAVADSDNDDDDDYPSRDYTRWNVCSDISIDVKPASVVSSLWGIDTDHIVFPCLDRWEVEASGERYGFADVELITPIFHWDDDGWRAQVRAVIAAVTTGEFRSDVNMSCGLHLHVGRGVAGFNVTEAKRIAAGVTLVEQQLDRLHPQHRENLYAKSLRWGEVLSTFSLHGVLEAIMGVGSVQELFALLQKGACGIDKRFKVNFLPLLRQEGRGTIEFRQHRGTLEVGEIERWVEFVLRFVVASAQMDEREMVTIVRDLNKQETGRRPRKRRKGWDPLFDVFVKDKGLRTCYEKAVDRDMMQYEEDGNE